MVQYQFANAARAYSNAEQVKGQRLRNTLLGRSIEEADELKRKQEEYEQIRSQHHNIPQAITKLREAGMHSEADQLAQQHLARLQAGVSYIKSARDAVNEDNYDEFRQRNIEGGVPADMFPVEYSDEWFRAEQKKTEQSLTHFTRTFKGEGGKTMSQSIVQKGGNVVDAGEPYLAGSQVRKPQPRAGADKKLKPSDLNALYKFVANEFGGTFHRNPETGEYEIFLEGEDAQMANDMALLAAELMGSQKMPIQQAVEEARKRVIKGSRSGVTGQARDPLGLL